MPFHLETGEYSYYKFTDQQTWVDFGVGFISGYRINKNLGIFIEGEYTKFWDSEMFNSNFGVNYTFR